MSMLRLPLLGLPLLLLLPLQLAAQEVPLPERVPRDGPRTAVVYTEFSGVGGALGKTLVQTCQRMCPLPGKTHPCQVKGDITQDGRFVTRNYRNADSAARYVEQWVLRTEPGNPCAVGLQLRRSAQLAAFDGANTVLTDIDFDRGTALRRKVSGRAGPVQTDVVRGVDALRNAGYLRVGPDRVAGFACERLRKTQGKLVQETCLLQDPAVPAAAAGVTLQGTPLTDSTEPGDRPEARSYSELRSLQFNVQVPTAVFAPPPNLPVKDARPLQPPAPNKEAQ